MTAIGAVGSSAPGRRPRSPSRFTSSPSASATSSPSTASRSPSRTGEVFGFLGPNGAGKTTTIKMLNGLLAPTSGSGRVAGFDIATERAAIKSSIGYMSQLFSLYGDLTVDENIGFFAGLYGVRGARLAARRAWVLEMAGLADQRDRPAGELALGWKQRLALGCAVLHEPPILFLDEPTSGVDPISRRRFWDLIYDLADGGTTVFVTTHYMEEAEYCNRLALMNRGRLDRPRHAGGPARRGARTTSRSPDPERHRRAGGARRRAGGRSRRPLRTRPARHGRATGTPP